jgi:hypothetical protein
MSTYDSPPTGAQASEHALAEHIRGERVRFVFIQSALPIVFSPLAAIVLSLTLWNSTDRNTLIWWTAGLVALCVVRIGTNIGFARAVAGEREIRRWERIFIASIMVVDLWWGVGALLLMPPQDILIVDAVVFAFVMLMAGGHAASYADAACQALVVDFENQRIAFTTSVGVASLQPGNTLDGWVAHADAALYRSKQEGRNRVSAT